MALLHLLGGLSLETGNGRVGGRAGQRKRLALLALLTATPRHTLSRDKLVAYFWPEKPSAIAHHLLASSIYDLRQALGDSALLTFGNDVTLDPAVVPSDLTRFHDAVAAGALEQAARLYAGPFLDGIFLRDAPEFDSWVEGQRARVSAVHAGVLEELATAAAARGDHTTSARWWERRAAMDPLSGRVARAYLKALADDGDTAAALRYARIYRATVRAELGTEPDATFLQAVADLSRGPTLSSEARSPSPTVATHSPPLGSPAIAPEARDDDDIGFALAAAWSEELHRPLRMIVGGMELLDLGVVGELSSEQRRHLARIRSATAHLRAIVSEMQETLRSRPEIPLNGKTRPFATEVDAAIDSVRPLADLRSVLLGYLRTDNPSLPVSGSGLVVRQMIIILLIHCIEFAGRDGTVELCAGTSSEGPPGEVTAPPTPLWTHLTVRASAAPPVQESAMADPAPTLGDPPELARRLAVAMGGTLVLQVAQARKLAFALWIPASRTDEAAGR